VKQALVVINPSSRDFEARRRFPELRGWLERFGTIHIVETVPDDEATKERIAAEVQSSGLFDRIIAIGGDGTVHLTVNALARVGLERVRRLAVIPFGTANDVAKSLGLPIDDYERLAEIAMGDAFGWFDLARVSCARSEGRRDERVFIDSVTIGMDADVLSTRRKFRDLKGYLSYLPAIAERAVEQQSIDVHVDVDGRSLDDRVFNVVINNAPIYAGEIELPGSKRDDGLLDVYLFNRREYASKLISFAIKQVDFLELGVSDLLEDLTENQRVHRGRAIRVRMASPRTIQVDGEVFGTTDEVECAVIGRLEVPIARAS
jgi:diacylglycerol kinase (ATP)